MDPRDAADEQSRDHTQLTTDVGLQRFAFPQQSGAFHASLFHVLPIESLWLLDRAPAVW